MLDPHRPDHRGQASPYATAGPAGQPPRPRSWRRVLQAMSRAGHADGVNAADWWAQDTVDARASGYLAPTARWMLTGIDDGDPLVLDTLPGCDLTRTSHERLYHHSTAAMTRVAPAWETLGTPWRAQALDAYTDAFAQGMLERVVDCCVLVLSDSAT